MRRRKMSNREIAVRELIADPCGVAEDAMGALEAARLELVEAGEHNAAMQVGTMIDALDGLPGISGIESSDLALDFLEPHLQQPAPIERGQNNG